MHHRGALTLMVLSAGTALGCMVAAACGSFSGGETPATEVADALIESSGDTPDVRDGGPQSDGGGDAATDGACKQGRDNRLVLRVGPVCIDALEVLVEKYGLFVDASAAVPDAGITACSGNNIHPGGPCAPAASDTPQRCVDWCDAYEYCEWAGKHLCGAIGGGPLRLADANSAKRDAWYRACAGADGGRMYAYGNVYDMTACQTEGSDVTDVGSKARCTTPEGVLDLIGNAREWIDSCEDPGSTCMNRGGVFSGGNNARCGLGQMIGRSVTSDEIGFRCCSD